MIARLTSYPATCHPDDVMKNALEDQYHNFFYLDVKVSGQYPSYMDRFFEENNVSIDITEADEKILRENIVDYISVSYYVSDIVCPDEERLESVTETEGNLTRGIKNPYLDAPCWGC